MACTRTLKIALAALVVLTGLMVVEMAVEARERGFRTVAGNAGYVKTRPRKINASRSGKRHARTSRRHGYRNSRSRGYRNGEVYNAAGAGLLTLGWHGNLGNRYDDDYIRRNSLMRDKVSDSPRRSASKIIHVSYKMLQLGESRAAKREARMLKEMENLDIRYYRDNEAYDARFPSIVYLDLLDR
jgi:hypothetical protein